jgi:dephospho-CoA kinase
VLTVALTGNVASGKSTVAGIWRDTGVPVISADHLAREVVERGSEGLSAVTDAFGPEIVTHDGFLRRDVLRGIVFQDPEKRALLESITHPLIRRRRDAWLEEMEIQGHLLAAAEVPLLFEADLADDFDVSVTVAASRDVSLRRLTDTRGISPEESVRIWEAQIDPSEKAARSDYVIWNDGGMDDLRAQALSLLDLLRARARREVGP